MTSWIQRKLPARLALGLAAALALLSAAIPGCGGAESGSTPGNGASPAADAQAGDDNTSAPGIDADVDASPGFDASGEGLPTADATGEASPGIDADRSPDATRLPDAESAGDAGGSADAAVVHDAGVGDAGIPFPDAAHLQDGGGCPLLSTPRALGGTARSSGFSGTPLAYDSISGAACTTGLDCVPTCVAAGGTMSSCALGSACLLGENQDGGLGCYPPSYWLQPNLALSELNMTGSAASLVLVATSYFDSLVVTDFGLSVPDGAVIRGIQFDVRRATLFGDAEDMTIQVLGNGSPFGTNHRQLGTAWPTTLTYVTYGGTGDTWGATWTAAEVRASGFGIAITPQYTMTAGNDPAYVDSVRATVYYTQCN
jgi:hypothetical protein